ncbi:MAG: hypothetical protein GKR87_11985 [Kiritimatiellae bacterium]|nr:hypothetical protein [Kiritimatiellia bacterium]
MKELHIIFSGLLLGTISFIWIAQLQSDFHPEDFGLGINTKVKFDADPPFRKSGYTDAQGSQQKRIHERFSKLRKTDRHIALWIGASQLHAINDLTEGDKPAVEYANEALETYNSNITCLQSSSPNAGFHDLLVLYQLFRQAHLFPDWLIIAIVYDDLREEEIQSVLLEQLQKVSSKASILRDKGFQHILEQQVRLKNKAKAFND